MPLQGTTYKIPYEGNGVTTVFAYPFYVLDQTHIKVTETDTVTGVDTVKTLTTHYTVSGIGEPSGGNVTAVSAPSATKIWTIERVVPYTQLLSLLGAAGVPVLELTKALDKIMMAIQQLGATGGQADRAIRYRASEPSGYVAELPTAAARANKLMSFDEDGNFIVTQELGTYRGDWVTGTLYNARDIVTNSVNKNVYFVPTEYTSGASVAADVGTDNLVLVFDAATSTAAAAASAAAALVSENNAETAEANAETAETNAEAAQAAAEAAQAAAEAAQAAAETAETNAETAETNAETAETNAETAQAAAAVSAALAATYPIPLWLTATDYVVGNSVYESNKLYRCPSGQAHTSGTFATDLAAGKWVEMSAAGGLTEAQIYDAPQYATTSGTDTYTATLSPAPTSYTTGMTVKLKIGNVNTGASTINLNSLGAKTIQKNGSALSAGDLPANAIAHLVYDGTNFQLSGTLAASGSSGKLAQVVSGSDNTPTSTTSSIPDDNTAPQNTEGTEIVTVSITPTDASSTLEIEYGVTFAADTAGKAYAAMFVDSTADAIDSMGLSNSGTSYVAHATKSFTISAGSTSARTYKLRVGINSGTIYINQRDSGARHDGLLDTYIRVREILP